MTNLDSILKSRNITLPTKVRIVKAMGFPVVMYGCENWIVKKADKPALSFFSFILIKKLFSSSSLSAIRVVSSVYLRSLIFLPGILIPDCTSSSPAFHMMYCQGPAPVDPGKLKGETVSALIRKQLLD